MLPSLNPLLCGLGLVSECSRILGLRPHRQIVEDSRAELSLKDVVVVHHMMLETQILNSQLHIWSCRELVMEAYESEATWRLQLCFDHDQLHRLASLRAGLFLFGAFATRSSFVSGGIILKILGALIEISLVMLVMVRGAISSFVSLPFSG